MRPGDVAVGHRAPAAAGSVSGFAAVLCDPPWAYEFGFEGRGGVEYEYPTMTVAELKGFRAVLADPPWGYDNAVPQDNGGVGDQYPTMTTEELKAMTVLADPPWQTKPGYEAAPERHYPTMPTPEIARVSVADLCAPDCALFMWATFPKLPDAIEVMAAWGFAFKTVAFTWIKLNPKSRSPFSGCGYWTRANAEICLLGTRGAPKRVAKDVQQLIFAPRREHSRKPDEQYERIERLVAGPYLELFSRTRWPGWHTLGYDDGKFTPPPRQASFMGYEDAAIEPPHRTATTLPLFAGIEEAGG